MHTVLNSAEMREVDRLTTERFAIPSLLLMESASHAAASEIRTLCSADLSSQKIVIICGPGNNGGDGAAVARRLWLDGAAVSVVLLVPISKTKGNARVNFEIIRRLADAGGKNRHKSARLEYVQIADQRRENQLRQLLQQSDVVVDAVFGTGLSRPLEGIFLAAVSAINRHKIIEPGVRIVALDVPSGLNSDLSYATGEAVHADLTVSFTAPKPANVLAPALNFNGRLVIAGIGSPHELVAQHNSRLFVTEASDAADWLVRTRYSNGSYKNVHGHALVVAGSRNMTGAAVLCCDAAMSSGAGLVTLATPKSALGPAGARLMPEVMAEGLDETYGGSASIEALSAVLGLMKKMTVTAIGPGLAATDDSTKRLVRKMVDGRTGPMVIDADGLNSLAPWPSDLMGKQSAPLILTPHQGEMLRLLGTTDKSTLNDRVATARGFAVAHKLILVLKGEKTLIADPEGNVFLNPTGNAGLGTAGAGDTLTGIITGFLAQEFGLFGAKADAVKATVAAVYTSGLAGDIAAEELGMRTMVASDIRRCFGAAVKSLDPRGEHP